jgi:hypothetical protein
LFHVEAFGLLENAIVVTGASKHDSDSFARLSWPTWTLYSCQMAKRAQVIIK